MRHHNNQLVALQKMKLNTGIATILGLVTLGGYWILFLKKWLNKNMEYKQSFYGFQLDESARKPYLERLETRTHRNQLLANITGILLVLGVLIFSIETVAELYFRKILFDEEPFWFFVWLVFSLFAVLLANVALQIKQTLEEEKELDMNENEKLPWLLQGDKTKIYLLLSLNVICALGLLPFVIFPPILGMTLNRYVDQEMRLIQNDNTKF